MFLNKEIVYTDILDEWRKVKILDFNLFDKVTTDEKEWIFIIIWQDTNSVYTDSKRYKWLSFYRNWRILNEWTNIERCEYDCYLLVWTDWKRHTCNNVKKYYWDFQKEFESLDKAIRDEEMLKQKIEEIKSLKESINTNYNNARAIQNKNYKDLWIL